MEANIDKILECGNHMYYQDVQRRIHVRLPEYLVYDVHVIPSNAQINNDRFVGKN